MTVSGSSNTIDGVESSYGNIVIMRVNTAEINKNYLYPDREPHVYNAAINPSLQRGKSIVEFTSLRKHRLSSGLVQVLTLRDDVAFDEPLVSSVGLEDGSIPPQTSLVVVRRTEQGMEHLYGPFECSLMRDGTVMLKASNAQGFDLYIAQIDRASVTFWLNLHDDDNEVIASFISRDELGRLFANASVRYDWVSDDELRDTLGRIARNNAGFTKGQVSSLKAAIETCEAESARIALNDERRARLVQMVSDYEDWDSLPKDSKDSALRGASAQQLADYVLTDENFEAFFDKVIALPQVRDRVDQAVAAYQAETEASRQEAQQAKAEAARAKEQLAEIETHYQEKKSQLTAEVEQESEKARSRRDELQQECQDLEGKLQELRDSKTLVEYQIRSVVHDMGDMGDVTRKILEDEMVRQVVAAVASSQPEMDSRAEDDSLEGESTMTCQQGSAGVILRGEDSLSDSEVIDRIYDAIGVRSGRNYSRNEVVDLLICLTQGYITTLAGLPGTGKTSLAGIVAGALGLLNEGSNRYCEIAVERGWTSYKDFIGYYNPLTQTMEKSDVATFDALNALDVEARAGDHSLSPFLFLLDEANLSSIEHYWAPFLKACDSFATKPTCISLGSHQDLLVPPYVRFWATVNFDQTTEELSPRFLDRSWVITLDPQVLDFDEDGTQEVFDASSQEALSATRLRKTFGKRKDTTSDVQATKFRAVVDCCLRNNWQISPRSQRMVRDFISAAAALMDTSTADTSYAPVDYAVAQKVLPLIAGPAEQVGHLVEDLMSIGGLPVCEARLEHMRKMGEESGFYQYFA